jgi:cyanophycin synthetase
MAEHSPAKHICYVTMTPNNAFVREHIRLGQRAAVLEHRESGDQIVLYDHGAPMPLLWTHLIPATVEGKALFNVENAMFAASMGYAMGLTLNQIRAGLRTFNNSYYQSPGRMNIFDELGFKVILDYGHNEAAIKSMVSFVERLNMRGERIVCLTTPGDRRDEDVLAVARAAAGKFTRYICHMDDDLRGREPREIPEILQKELIACGVAPEAIEIIPKESEAVDRALSVAKQNDLVLLFCGGITRAWKQIIYFKPSNVVAPAKEPLVEPETDLDVPPGYTVVRDERGIRLLRRA